jgi:heme-degrading monooxygenase HmoA
MEIHEFISSVFKPGLSLEDQQRTMDALGVAVSKEPGFLSRECFYSEKDGRWLVKITWESEEAVEHSSKMAHDPGVAQLYEDFDVEAMMYGRYERRGPAGLS